MSRRPRIVAVADSLALPRTVDGELLLWEETWPYLLEDLIPGSDVINCGARARASAGLLGSEMVELLAKRPDLVVVQIGIVDCSPRVFTPLEKRLLALPVVPPFVRRRVIAHRSARRAEITRRDPLGRVQTPPPDFARDLRAFSQQTHPIPLIFLPVLADPVRMEQKSPGHGGNVRLYNELLRTAARERGARFVEPGDILGPDDLGRAFVKDGYHLSAHGNRRVADALAPVVSAVLAR